MRNEATCSYCIYCECRNRRYRCRYDGDEYFVMAKDPACEDYVKAEEPAYKEKGKAIPRVRGKQW